MPVSEGYGLTETSPVTHYNLSAFSKITGFISKEKFGIGVPSPDTECRLVDPETGQEAPLGEPGEIVVRGPQIMKGYWPEPGAGLTADGWLHTGDIAVMEDDGYFQVVDRYKDMVNVSGLKVYTTEVDQVLYGHPAVLTAAAFGVPDRDNPGSERVMAVIQLKEHIRGSVTEQGYPRSVENTLLRMRCPSTSSSGTTMPLTVTERSSRKRCGTPRLPGSGEGGIHPNEWGPGAEWRCYHDGGSLLHTRVAAIQCRVVSVDAQVPGRSWRN